MVSRRHFIKLASSSTGLLINACSIKPLKIPTHHVVVIGGGFGGATAAKYIRKLDPSIKVTLIEANRYYMSCPTSNWVFTGLNTADSLRFNYEYLSKYYGITVIHDKVQLIDSENHSVIFSKKQTLHYDRLIVSPGIDFRWDLIKGHSESSTHLIPHAWKAGQQTQILNNQLKNMRNGGTVVICAPPNPYRCPPAPYERASMMAYYLKKFKPRSKIIILDPKTHFSKQALFTHGWEKHYGYNSQNSLIEWIPIPDNPVISIDVKNKIATTDFGDQFKADVLNYIPTQKAGKIAQSSGLCDVSGWCPVTPKTAESLLHKGIHVIGDASNYNPIPKSAFAANSEAKNCAFAVVNLLKERDLINPLWINTCYSLITPEHGISVAMVYKLNREEQLFKVKGAGGTTQPMNEGIFSTEAQNAKHWFNSITKDSFKK